MPWPVPPNAPVPSTADYSAKNVAPLFTFFAPLVNRVLGGTDYTKTDLKFRYENNTPDDPSDDIFVVHPEVLGDTEYTDPPCIPKNKRSKELLAYEKVAKKSKRLDNWRKKQPIVIDYFDDLECGFPQSGA
jgi:hypothetical protein